MVVADAADTTDVVEEMTAEGNVAIGVTSDVSTLDGANTIIDTAVATFGRVDVVVNNAGILRSDGITDTPDDVWDEVLDVNLRGAFRVTRAAWPRLREHGHGRVVFATSNAGLLGVPGSSAYAASKAALWGLVRVLALEGAEVGIRTNAVAPIAFTSMSAASRAAPRAWKSGEGDAWAKRLSTSQVAPVVAWLAHETCELNGEVLSVAGGRVARFFMGLTPGFVEDGLTAEAVRDRQEEILAVAGFEVLSSAADEARRLHRRVMP